MAQLHEILAVEKAAKDDWRNKRTSTRSGFDQTAAYYSQETSIAYYDDARSHLDQVEPANLTRDVDSELTQALVAMAKAVDVAAAKDRSNCYARADIILNDVVIAENVPAVTLLGLETTLEELAGLVDAAPVLEGQIDWERNTRSTPHKWVSKEARITQRTEKEIVPRVLYEATDRHPAQVETISRDVPVADITKHVFSGAMQMAHKKRLQQRIADLLNAVRQARQRANTEDAAESNLGAAILSCIRDFAE